MRIVVRSLLVLLALVVVSGSTAATSGARPLVLKPKWSLSWRGGVQSVAAQGRYVLLQVANDGTAVLVDDQTGQKTALDPTSAVSSTGCRSGMGYPRIFGLGYPWVFISCGGTGTALYSIPRQSWQMVRFPNSFCGVCGSDLPSAAGRYWIEFRRFVHEGPCCSVVSYRYQNIKTGQVASDPTTATTVPDLDQPRLVRRVCSPVRVPKSFNDHANGLGSLRFDGKFVLADSLDAPIFNGTFSNAPSGEKLYLDRCGSSLHMKLTLLPTTLPPAFAPTVSTTHAVMTAQSLAGQSRLTGVLLPSLRRLVIDLPMEDRFGEVALSAQRLYWLSNGRVWVAPSPAPG